MDISSRHHYIPRFLINQFTDEAGMLHVYDKEKQEFKSPKQSPKQIFYEWNRNTRDFHGIASDNFEKLYAEMDTLLSKGLLDILRRKEFTEDNFFPVMMLVSMIKWRIPANDAEFDKQKEKMRYEDLPIRVSIDADDNEKARGFEYLINSEVFKDSKRFILPMLPFYDDEKIKALLQYSYVNTNEHITSVIGDVPLIEREVDDRLELADFIFPLSNTDTLVFNTSGNHRILNRAFYYNKDLAIFHLSNRYVSCRDKVHLERLVELHQSIQQAGIADQITRQIFSFT